MALPETLRLETAGPQAENIWEPHLCTHVGLWVSLYLDVSLRVQVVVPQDDLVVLAPSCQQGAAPHLTQGEHAAVVPLDLPADLVHACGRSQG